MKMYTELAEWWPLLSAPEDYAEEAAIYARLLRENATIPLREVLELGSGGGNNASHMVRLGREFDAVFAHDAVCYMTTEADLRAAIATAGVHCKPGGVVLFAPDYVRENFSESTDHGGHDGEGRALRYLEWCYDSDASDTLYEVDYAFVLHEDGRPPRTLLDHHVEGLFSKDDWLRWLDEAGFDAREEPFIHTVVDYVGAIFVGVKR